MNEANENVTVNFGVIQGGLIANAIAEDCFARIDVRFWTSKQCDEFFAKFKKEFETPFGQDIKANYDVLLINPAMEEFEKTEELKQKIEQLNASIAYIEYKQQFYDDVLNHKIPYVSNLKTE